MKKYYLAYGSNLNTVQMSLRCPTARVMGTAILEDYELVFKGSKTGAYLTVEQKQGSKVPVAVWSVGDSDEQALDYYEGYPKFYYKKEMTVTFTGIKSNKKRTRTAFMYIMHEDRPVGVPTFKYVQTCLDGYRIFNFDIAVLMQAVDYSIQEATI
jgi:hypothetical protein|nr:MAG TPA: hypothetical protein [Caudoviricetes sp.]